MFNFIKDIFGKAATSEALSFPKDAVILDVRTPAEYKQGHIDGSANIPLDELSSKIVTIRKWNKPVVTVCRSGSRSAAAKQLLSSHGITAVNGGAWTHFKNK